MRSRARALLAVVTSAPWRRAPMLLWRRPGVLAAVAGGCMVLAASAASVPLFLSSAGTGAVGVQARARCPRDSGAAVSQSFVVPGVPAADDTLPAGPAGPDPAWAVPADAPVDPFAGLVGLAPADVAFTMDAELAGATEGAGTQVVLLARDDGVDHVERLDGTGGPGLWVSDRAASATDLAPGDTATVVVDVSPFPERGPRDSRYERVEVPVAGIYRDLAGAVPDDYWCSQASLFEFEGLDPVPPPPVVLLDRALLVDMAGTLGVGVVGGEWEARLALDDLTLADAGELSAALEEATPAVETHLPFVAERARAIRTAVAGGVLPVAGFGAVAGAGLVGAASTLWHDRRRREVTLLAVRGAPPGAIGFKAVLELSPALVGGTAAGIALASGLVVGLGPSPLIEPWAMRGALAASAGALLVATSVVASVVALRVRRANGRHVAARGAAWVPWEVVLVGAALVSYRRLGEWGVPVSRGTDLSRVDVFGLFFPLLFLLAIVAVAARLLGLALRPLRTASDAWPPVPFLVVRRVARHRVAVLGLVAASAVAAGVLGYAATLTGSLNATLDAKAHTFVGSDVAVTVTEDDPVPEALEGTATAVEVYRGATLDTGDRLEDANLLVVDPDTFARAAFWDDSFADRSLGAVLDALAEPTEDGRLRAVVVGADIAGASPSTDVEVRRRRTSPAIGIERLAGVDEFPGMRPQQPTVVLARTVAADLELRDGSTEVWVQGDRDQILRAFGDAGIAYREDRTVDGVVDRVAFLTVSWTFGVLQALGAVAGLLALGGMALYLDARRRSRVLGYAFARRMGLGRAAHRRVLVAELVASVVVGCWLGLAAAWAGARLAYSRIDPVPGLPPGPLLRPALALMAALGLAAFAVAVVAAVLAQRRTDRDDPLDVLRAGI